MKSVQYLYKGQIIDFEHTGGFDVMVNATQISNIFGKQVKDFLNEDNTKKSIKACLKSDRFKTLEDLIIINELSEIWIHRFLAIKFAEWINTSFEVWIIFSMEKIINRWVPDADRDAMRQMYENVHKKTVKLHKKMLEEYFYYSEYIDLKEIEAELEEALNAIDKGIEFKN